MPNAIRISSLDLSIHSNLYYYKNRLFTGETISYYGTISYIKNGNLHREDGPAVICSNGAKEYWLNGKKLKICCVRRHVIHLQF